MRPFKHPPVSDFILERLLYALSDPVRLEIVRRLAESGEASCGELDGGRPKSTMSHHFRILRDVGLVHTQTIGTTHMNSLRKADVDSRFPGLLDAIVSQKP
ncbi:helix-turn-helix transcriptional regulator [Halomonas aquamarina]|uniref:Helix-turn-helix transcriptional regulator n=1 Tax=Vreelandella aquamarina TaxID=77097 RepID=A0ACC5VQ48_9GAMM|nr:helix-turn-helix domain-containing protein [Halomonas aquamarina]MBZ5486365.1 helix-turn-helix transcriptional regulator [Halomonas aquamarina]